jgi:hypothetical protein
MDASQRLQRQWSRDGTRDQASEVQSRRWNKKIHHRASRADCDGGLWSHIDTPIQRGEFDGKAIYLIRWKLCWTRESDIDDMSWGSVAKEGRFNTG